MATWPTDLKSDQKIGFGWADMPDQMQNITDYRAASTSGAPGGVIFLPLPAQIEDNLSHTWNKTKGMGSATLQKGLDLVKGGVDALSGGLATAFMDATGQHLDPNFFYTYQYTEPRVFTYSVNMIPKNAQEAETISIIVKLFKTFSSPRRGTFVKNYKWGIEISNPAMKEMTKFDKNPWALTSVTTNYSGAGSALFFDDGNPKQINLTLVFQEMQTMYDSDWA